MNISIFKLGNASVIQGPPFQPMLVDPKIVSSEIRETFFWGAGCFEIDRTSERFFLGSNPFILLGSLETGRNHFQAGDTFSKPSF